MIGALVVEPQDTALVARALRQYAGTNGGLSARGDTLLGEAEAAAAVVTGSPVSGRHASNGSPEASETTPSVTVEAVGTRLAAEQLGITERGVRDLCERGSLEARKVGRRWLIDQSAITANKEA